MAEGVGLSISTSFLERLNQADKLYQKLTTDENDLSRLTIKAFNEMTQKGVVPYVESLKEQKAALEGIAKIRMGKNATQEMIDMKENAKSAVKEINKLISTLTRTKGYGNVISGASAMAYSQGILGKGGDKSIYNMEQALNRLKEAQSRLNLNTKEGQQKYRELGKEIFKVENELNKVKTASQQVISGASAMGNMLTAAFSISTIRGFVNQLIAVRGEFELQHRSLQILLQDADKANELWEKTVTLAVKSPFRVKELVTYTKQLAGYRVEYDKLYDTTRMLADVSAGLGVDMNRLILAFGQVKAANFLRGTELRQFTEAGVNLLDELAKRFSKLEGRAVSIGDVFDRVSKRLVKFSDVEAVFQTITSEGGMFYQMQEKQSETLRGMIMNLKDSVDLLFNELGKSQEGRLKDAIVFVRSLIDNWQRFIPLIKEFALSMTVAFATKQLLSFIRLITVAIKQIGTFGVSLSLLKSINVWSTIVGVLTAVISHIVNAKKKVDELTAAMNNIDKETNATLEEMIRTYRSLAEKTKDATLSEKERARALEQLKAKYGEILPDQLLELKYIQDISDNYNAATEALMNYYNTKAVEQKKDKAESEYGEDIGAETAKLQKRFRKLIEDSTLSIWSEDKTEAEAIKVKLKAYSSDIIHSVILEAKEGTIKLGEIEDEIKKRLSSFVDVPLESINKAVKHGGTYFFTDVIANVQETIGYYQNAIDIIDGLQYETLAQKEASDIFLPQKENIEEAKIIFKKAINAFNQLSQQTVETWEGTDEEIFAMLKKLPPEMASYAELLTKMFEKLKEAAKKGSFEFGKELQGFQQEFYLELPTVILGEVDDFDMNTFTELANLVSNANESLRTEASNLNLNDFQKSVVEAMEKIASQTKVSVNEFAKFIPKVSDSLTTTREAVESEIGLIQERITVWENSLKADATIPLTLLRPDALGNTEKEIDEAKKLLAAYKLLHDFLGGKGEKKGKTSTDKTIEQRIQVVTQLNQKYSELKKTLSDSDALKGALDAYRDALATAMGDDTIRTMSVEEFIKNILNFPDEKAIIEWFEEFEKTLSKETDKFKVNMAKSKFVMDIEVRTKKEMDAKLEQEIQRMLDGYKLSVELKNIDIPTDLAKSLFGVESTSLDDVRAKIEEELSKASAQKGNEDRIKQLKEDLKKINEMEAEAQMERLKTYLQYTRKAISERAKIKIDELKKIREIEDSFNKAEEKATTEEDKKRVREQKALALKGVQEETQQKENKQDWEDFKSSDAFIQLFDDLENASDTLINSVRAKLQAFKDEWTDMPIDTAKEMIAKLNELDLALMDTDRPRRDNKELRSNLQAAMDARGIKGSAKDARSQAELTKQVTEENVGFEEDIALSQQRIAALETINNLNSENKQQELERLGITKEYISSLGLGEEVLSNTVEQNNELVTGEKEQIKNTNSTIASNRKILNTQKKISQNSQELSESISTAKKLANDLYDAFKGLYKALGGDEDGPAAVFADMGMNMMNTVLDTILLILQLESATIAAQGLGAAMKTASGVIGWIVMAVELVVQALTAVFTYADKKREEQIEAYIQKAKSLKAAYDDVADSVDKALSFSQLSTAIEDMKALNKQMDEAIKKAIMLKMSSKKKHDADNATLLKLINDPSLITEELLLDPNFLSSYKDKEREALIEYLRIIKDGKEELKEAENELLSSLGGITVEDQLSLAEDFVDAWLESFKETGNGLTGLEENFDEFFENLIKKKAALTIASNQMQGYVDAVNKALSADSEGGYEITEKEEQEIKAAEEETKHKINSVLLSLFKGLDFSENAGSELTALQKGIQGVTEQTAQVIEALLNSMRMYQADSNAELKSQTRYMRSMYELIESSTRGESFGFNVRVIPSR